MSENDHTIEKLRATFADDPISADKLDSESNGQSASRWLLAFVGFVLVALFVGVSWFAYQLGIEEGARVRETTATLDTPAATQPSEETASPSIDQTTSSPPLRYPDEPVEQPPSPVTAEPAADLDRAVPQEPPSPEVLSDEVPAFEPDQFVIQVASRPTVAEAIDYFEAFRADHREILEGKTAYMEQLDLGDRGVWHRLRIGPYASFNAAESACAQIEANQGECLVATP